MFLLTASWSTVKFDQFSRKHCCSREWFIKHGCDTNRKHSTRWWRGGLNNRWKTVIIVYFVFPCDFDDSVCMIDELKERWLRFKICMLLYRLIKCKSPLTCIFFFFEWFNLFCFFVKDRDLVNHQQVKGQYFFHVKLIWFNHFNVLTNLSMIVHIKWFAQY